jgi:hypothetical protein
LTVDNFDADLSEINPQAISANSLLLVKNSRYKRHVLDPGLTNFLAYHVVRDPRDLMLSAYFSHRYSHPVDNHWGRNFLANFRAKLEALSIQEGLEEEFEVMENIFSCLSSWDYHNPSILELRFEEMIERPIEVFSRACRFMDISLSEASLDEISCQVNFKKLSGGRMPGEEDVHSHHRKGVPGDWKNYFNDAHKAYFKKRWGNLLIQLRYETSDEW